jgi:chaperonin GroES
LTKEETMKFRPLHDRVVVKRVDADEKSKGGIIIPDTAKEKPQEGEVMAVGPGGRDESGKLVPLDLKVGDRILFGKWSGTEIKMHGEELLIMKESDVMGVMEGRATESRATESRPAQSRATKSQAAKSRATESRPAQSRATKSQAAKSRAAPARKKAR